MRNSRQGPAGKTSPSTKRAARASGSRAASGGANARDLAPPEMRYQYLRAGPGRSPWAVRGIAGAIGLGGAVTLALVTNLRILLGTAPVIAAIVGGLFRGFARLLGPSKDYRAAPVAIVPWGILVDPDTEPRALPWPKVRELSFTRVDRQGSRNNDAPAVTIMLFDTEAGVVQAQGDDGEWVSSIDAFAPRFARSALRGPAGDLTGTDPLDTTGLPPTLALLRRAEAVLDSADGRSSLGIEAGNYRTISSKTAGPETKQILRDALWNDGSPLDPGPLAAVLTAELGVTDLLPDLLRLILSTSPLLAATARAAARKLGASPAHAGSLDEIAHFLPEQDLTELRRWTDASARSHRGPADREDLEYDL